jgi:hypothetical protein
MKTEKELRAEINAITITILERYPHLSRHLIGVPPKTTIEVLQEYYDSLDALLRKSIQGSVLRKYIINHHVNQRS